MDSRAREHEHEQERRPAERQPEPAPKEAAPAERLASAVGNQAFGSLIARQGAGILPDGRAHPDVEATIARTRGNGTPLDPGVRSRFGPSLGHSLDDVRVHNDDTAHKLATSVSAKAFTTGSDVYFGKGEYSPGSSDGDKLIAHELTHVVQQRGAATSGPLQVSKPGEPLEVEADRASGELLG